MFLFHAEDLNVDCGIYYSLGNPYMCCTYSLFHQSFYPVARLILIESLATRFKRLFMFYITLIGSHTPCGKVAQCARRSPRVFMESVSFFGSDPVSCLRNNTKKVSYYLWENQNLPTCMVHMELSD